MTRRTKAARRPAKIASAAYLERAALHYLTRYGGSEARLRRILRDRVRRSVEERGTDPEDGAQAIEAVVEKLRRVGLIDDARLARERVRVLRGRGKSARAIRSTLRRQGLDASLIDAALEEATDELEAARTFARKKRIGPHREADARAARREKDLAKLARAGFSYGVARRVLDEDLDER